jgi:hypothetical protein
MPRPTKDTAIQRPDLGALAYEYLIDAANRGFIGMEVMPVFEVPEQSADYPIIPVEALLGNRNTRRNAKGDYPRGDWEFETGTYKCQEYGWEEVVDDVEAKLYSRFFEAEQVSTEIAVDRILRGHEQRVAATAFSGATNNVTHKWSSAANATPKADIEDARLSMRAATGLLPNALVMGYSAFRNAVNTKEMRDAFAYTNPIEIGGEEAQKRLLAQYFGVDRVLVGGSIQNSAKRGQSATLTDIWASDKAALMVLSNGGPRLREPVYGRSFLWYEDSPQEVVVETYREESRRSTIVRARQYIGEAVIFEGAKYLIGNLA